MWQLPRVRTWGGNRWRLSFVKAAVGRRRQKIYLVIFISLRSISARDLAVRSDPIAPPGKPPQVPCGSPYTHFPHRETPCPSRLTLGDASRFFAYLIYRT